MMVQKIEITTEKLTKNHHVVIAGVYEHTAIDKCTKIQGAIGHADALDYALQLARGGYKTIYILKTIEYVKGWPVVCGKCGQPITEAKT